MNSLEGTVETTILVCFAKDFLQVLRVLTVV